jgi:hypothetical protein
MPAAMWSAAAAPISWMTMPYIESTGFFHGARARMRRVSA